MDCLLCLGVSVLLDALLVVGGLGWFVLLYVTSCGSLCGLLVVILICCAGSLVAICL